MNLIRTSSNPSVRAKQGGGFSLADLLTRLREQEHLRDLLVHGSKLSDDPDAYSDIDLIGLSEGRVLGHSIRVFEGHVIDAFYGTLETLRAAIRSDVKTNTNWVLFALISGHAVPPVSDDFKRLLAEAQERWVAGPNAPSDKELPEIALALSKLGTKATRLAARPLGSTIENPARSLSLAQMCQHAISFYCRTNRLWASSIKEMLSWDDPSYSVLQKSIKCFMLVSDPCACAKSLHGLCAASIATLQKDPRFLPEWAAGLEQVERLYETVGECSTERCLQQDASLGSVPDRGQGE